MRRLPGEAIAGPGRTKLALFRAEIALACRDVRGVGALLRSGAGLSQASRCLSEGSTHEDARR